MIKKSDFFVMLIGRPNVGKSTIFNKILGKTSALSSKISGTTLDLNIKKISYENEEFLISDSGGFNISPANEMEKKIKEKVFEYSKKAGLILFTVDYKSGFIPEDKEIFLRLLKAEANIALVINKVDSPRDRENAAAEFAGLGIKGPIPVSAETGSGIDDVLDRIMAEINLKKPVRPLKKHGENSFKTAIIGRPNSGKSTFINTILKEELLFTDERPGTTRDSIDTYIKYKGYDITLIDTAGIRKKSRLDVNSAAFQEQSLNQIKRADVAVVFIDINAGITHEDLSLLKRIATGKKSFLIAFTKWDLKDRDNGGSSLSELNKDLKFALKEFSETPFIFISSLTNKNLSKLLDIAIEINNSRKIKIKTKELNRFIEDSKAHDGPGKLFRHISYGVQKEGEEIPTFILFTGNKRKIFYMNDIKRLRAELKKRFAIKSGVEVLIEYK